MKVTRLGGLSGLRGSCAQGPEKPIAERRQRCGEDLTSFRRPRALKNSEESSGSGAQGLGIKVQG